MSKDSSKSPMMRFKKILVALDASSHSMAALELAARLAQQLEAELHGLFVEDEDWFALSKLSTTSEISDLTGTLRRLEEGDMERQVMSLASRIRRAIEQRARHHRIQHRFETRRGHVDEELLEAARNADLITLGRIGHSVWGGIEVGKTAQRLINESETPLLLLQQGYSIGGAITVVDNPDNRQKLLRVASSLASKLRVKLRILDVSANTDRALDAAAQIKELMDGLYKDYEIQRETDPNINQISYLLQRFRTGMLIADRQWTLLQGRNLERMVSDIQCPILLI